MNTQEIQSEAWASFCKKFTETNRSSLLTIELIGVDGVQKNIARDAALEEMSFEKTTACNDFINISVGHNGSKRLNHVVVEPIDLLVKESPNGQKILQIRAENGTTLVTFHSGRFPPTENGNEPKRFAKSSFAQ